MSIFSGGGMGLNLSTSFGDITGALGNIFGKNESTTTTTTSAEDTSKRASGISTERLELDDAALQKIISDVLGGERGLASILGGEQTAGLYSSSVAAKESRDLVTNLVGELAKITGKTIKTDETAEDIRARGSSIEEESKKQRGLLEDAIGFSSSFKDKLGLTGTSLYDKLIEVSGGEDSFLGKSTKGALYGDPGTILTRDIGSLEDKFGEMYKERNPEDETA